MRISDWSSDVCSSDLRHGGTGQVHILEGKRGRRRAAFTVAVGPHRQGRGAAAGGRAAGKGVGRPGSARRRRGAVRHLSPGRARKSVGEGKGVSVRVDPCGRRIIKKKKNKTSNK